MLESVPGTNQYWAKSIKFLAQVNKSSLRWGLNSSLTGIHWLWVRCMDNLTRLALLTCLFYDQHNLVMYKCCCRQCLDLCLVLWARCVCLLICIFFSYIFPLSTKRLLFSSTLKSFFSQHFCKSYSTQFYLFSCP